MSCRSSSRSALEDAGREGLENADSELPEPGISPFDKPPDVVFYGWRVAADVRTLGRWLEAGLLTST